MCGCYCCEKEMSPEEELRHLEYYKEMLDRKSKAIEGRIAEIKSAGRSGAKAGRSRAKR